MKFLILLIYTILSADCERIFEISKKYTNYPSTITGISLTESSCGKAVLGDDGKSLGIMQLQIPTVRYLVSKDPSLRILKKISNKQLETLLLRDDELSILIASKLFHFLLKNYGYKNAIIRYNGYWAVDSKGKALRDSKGNKIKNIQYYERVKRNMKKIKS